MGGWFYFAEVSCEMPANIALIGDILDTDIYKAGCFRLFLFCGWLQAMEKIMILLCRHMDTGACDLLFGAKCCFTQMKRRRYMRMGW